MKLISFIPIILLAIALFFIVDRQQTIASQRDLLEDFQTKLQESLVQIEEGSRNQFALNNSVKVLKSETSHLNAQIHDLEDELIEMEQRVDPDYWRIEEELRQELTDEIQRSQLQRNQLTSRVDLMGEMADLSSLEFSEYRSVRSQFGDFLQALDVSDDRMELIVGDLFNLVADQNWARQELGMQRRNGELSRREYRSGSRTIMSQGRTQEALTYILTNEEMSMYQTVLAEQRAQRELNRRRGRND